ncbi:hypothetical protein GQ54DRAFT_71526 [Martensiomyces pterosporus]|nr:hypothetical protein GQ54DRAFT_71526 [Martensiomyces pterosporus]
MLSLKRLLTWCAGRITTARCRKPWMFCRSRACSLDVARQYKSDDQNASFETLVNEKHRTRAFSDPGISDYQHIYSYYPWSESEHEDILSRSPPPSRPHYETFPSLVEMGGLLTL